MPWIAHATYEYLRPLDLGVISLDDSESSFFSTYAAIVWESFPRWGMRELVRAVAQVLVIRAVFQSIRGGVPTFRQSVGGVHRHIVSFLVVVAVLLAIGFVLLLAYGLLIERALRSGWSTGPYFPYYIFAFYGANWALVTPLFVAIPVAAIEGRSALRRSAFLTRGRCLRVFGILVGLQLVASIVDQLLMRALLSPGLAFGLDLGFHVLHVSFSAVVAAVAYHRLRLEKEGVDVTQLQEIFA